MSGRVRCQPSRVVDLDVFSEFSEVVWSGWMLVLNISKFSKKLISHKLFASLIRSIGERACTTVIPASISVIRGVSLLSKLRYSVGISDFSYLALFFKFIFKPQSITMCTLLFK